VCYLRQTHQLRVQYIILRQLTNINTAPQSPQEKLEKFLDNRPSPAELKQRNILKDSKVAPSLQSAQVLARKSQYSHQAELERKRLEDELSAKLSIRPTPDELVEQRILNRLPHFKETQLICSR
jgi:hypothetical protein